MISTDFFHYIFKQLARQIYWLFRLSKVKFGKGKMLQFPIQVEGKGVIQFGNNARLQKRMNLGIASGSFLSIGHHALIEQEATILAGQQGKLTIGDNFKLGTRARLYVQNHWQFGNDVKIETNCVIGAREPNKYGKLSIGNGTHIGDYTIIDLVDDVTIGNEVAIGPNCTIYSHDHIYDNPNKAAWKGGLTSAPIVIEDGVWIGSGVTILPGVTIGKGAVVAASSVVTKSIESNTINGGVPAKLIKKR